MPNQLMHWGVKGMRWGVRRKSSEPSSADHDRARSIQRKSVDQMSNDELKQLTTRLQFEKQYKDLTHKEFIFGKKFIEGTLQSAGKQLAGKYIADFAESVILKLLKKSVPTSKD